MTKKFSVLMAAVAVCGMVGQAKAAVVSFTSAVEAPSAAAVAAGAPMDGLNKYFLTSDADIVSINNVQITTNGGTIYQVPPPFGSNTSAPDPAFITLNRALEADSWITTPGSTSLLGPDMPGDGTSTWGDLSNDGAQTNFQFAQITVPGGMQGTFTGRVALNDNGTAVNFDFSLPINIPEPGSVALLGMGLVSLVGAARRRRG